MTESPSSKNSHVFRTLDFRHGRGANNFFWVLPAQSMSGIGSMESGRKCRSAQREHMLYRRFIQLNGQDMLSTGAGF